MNPLDLNLVCEYVNTHISDFHARRLKTLAELRLETLLRKNPYLFRAKNIVTANELITGLLDAFLSSSEEKLFGDFLEGLAVYIAQLTCGGHKSAATGVDLEFIRDNIHYIVSVKSGPNWGNSSQQNKLEQDLKAAVNKVKQANHSANVQPVLGICYGKTRTSYLRNYMKVVGQSFWYFISGDPQLYVTIIEPVGYNAKFKNDAFAEEKAKITNTLTMRFVVDFCEPSGAIDWPKLVEFNSHNLTITP